MSSCRPTSSSLDQDYAVVVDAIGLRAADPLPDPYASEVFAMGDGFGPIGEAVFAINSGWDWSHVRDSSSGAIRRMAARVREVREELRRQQEPSP